MAKEPLGLGLVGCGAFGRFCLEAYAALGEVRIAAVADVAKGAADALAAAFSVPAHYAPEGLIARDDVQIVHVATPPGTHRELVLAAAGAGKHCLCEKPLALTVAQADEMLAAAKSAGVIAPVDFVLRHNEVTEAVKDIIDSGVLGKVLSARLTNCASDGSLPPGHWFWNREMSGGIFIEHGVHFFDLYRYWLGAGEVLDAHAEAREGTGQQDRVTCTVRHAGGAVASHYHGFDQPTMLDRTDHRLVCELGDIRVEGWIPLTVAVDGVLDDDGASRLAGNCPWDSLEILERYTPERGQAGSRGKQRNLTQRIRLRYTPNPDKQAVYADSVRALLADQVAYLRDRAHQRVVTEENGRESLALAAAAVRLAAGRP